MPHLLYSAVNFRGVEMPFLHITAAMFVSMPFNEEESILINVVICIKDTHRGC